MIKLFRTIRQKLIEQGKTTNYLKYAIGEILLVVIGILIALQINNWNQEKKAQKELLQYLETIQENLKSDQTVIDSLIVRRQRIVDYSKKTRLSFLNKEFDFYTTRYGLSGYTEFYFTPNTSGYDALKNSPYVGRINGTNLNNLLVEYHALIDLIAQQEKSFNEFVENLEAQMAFETDRTLMMANNFMNPEELEATKTNKEEIVTVFKEIYESSGYRNIVSQAAIIDITIIPHYKSLNRTGTQIIQILNQFSND